MAKYLIVATRTTEYEIEVEADFDHQALGKLDDWIADDFEPYTKQNTWDFEVLENE